MLNPNFKPNSDTAFHGNPNPKNSLGCPLFPDSYLPPNSFAFASSAASERKIDAAVVKFSRRQTWVTRQCGTLTPRITAQVPAPGRFCSSLKTYDCSTFLVFLTQMHSCRSSYLSLGKLSSSRVCGNGHGMIRKYGINTCRQCFRIYSKDIGFVKVPASTCISSRIFFSICYSCCRLSLTKRNNAFKVSIFILTTVRTFRD